MLDIKSESYKEIVRQVKSLEHKRYVHILLESSSVATVELVRMKLNFKVDCSQDDSENGLQLESNEFRGMYISGKQKIGTLYGLKSGLILENRSNDSKILLMPHGESLSLGAILLDVIPFS